MWQVNLFSCGFLQAVFTSKTSMRNLKILGNFGLSDPTDYPAGLVSLGLLACAGCELRTSMLLF
jgi:hypothetical protein